MLIRKYFFIAFFLVFFWNGKNRQISEKDKKIIEQKEEQKRKKLLQIDEIKNYNIKIFEMSLFLQKAFATLRKDLQKVEIDFPEENIPPDYLDSLEKIGKSKKLVLLIKSFELNYKAIEKILHHNIMRIKKSRQKKSAKKISPNLIEDIFRKNLHLTKSLAKLTFTRNIFISLEKKDSKCLDIAYQHAKKKTEKYFSKKGKTLAFQKAIKESCYNLDAATIFGPQVITRIKLLAKEYLAFLKRGKRKSMEPIFLKQTKETKMIDDLQGCLETYKEIYKEITNFKIPRIKKFLTNREYKARKLHLEEKLLYIASQENRKRDKEKEDELLEYLEQKAQKSSKEEQSEIYRSYTKHFKRCLQLEDRLFSDS